MEMRPILSPFLQKYFSELSEWQQVQLERYVSLLEAYNQKINLISRSDIARIIENHLIPSLVSEKCFPIPPASLVVDLGSGGGLPGIPLQIIRPDLHFTLIDSSRKKAAFLRKAAQELNLTNTTVHMIRVLRGIEPRSLKNRFDVVVARGVASLPALEPLACFLLKTGGFLWAWKGKTDIPELREWADRKQFRFRIFSPPKGLISFSDKLIDLRYVAVWFN